MVDSTSAEPARAAAARCAFSQLRPIADRGLLFAVLDAAGGPEVLALLQAHPDPFLCLFGERQARQLATVAPYVVKFALGSPLLSALLWRGWGRGLGIYVVAEIDLAEVRRQLRRHLFVTADDDKTYYFRYFDPRVFRAFLPSCSLAQQHDLFGNIGACIVEDAEPSMLIRYERHCAGVDIRRAPLCTGDCLHTEQSPASR